MHWVDLTEANLTETIFIEAECSSFVCLKDAACDSTYVWQAKDFPLENLTAQQQQGLSYSMPKTKVIKHFSLGTNQSALFHQAKQKVFVDMVIQCAEDATPSFCH